MSAQDNESRQYPPEGVGAGHIINTPVSLARSSGSAATRGEILIDMRLQDDSALNRYVDDEGVVEGDQQPANMAWNANVEAWDQQMLAHAARGGANQLGVEAEDDRASREADRRQRIRQRMLQESTGTTIVSAYPIGEETTKAMIGLGFIIGSLFFNVLAVISLTVTTTTPQFSYVNETRMYVYLSGEGPGSVLSSHREDLPPCIAHTFSSVQWDVVASAIASVIALVLLPTCWLWRSSWRFVRPLMMASASVVMVAASYVTIQQYNLGCDNKLRSYRTEKGFWNLILGACCCLIVACGNFAQVSRYPLDRFPLIIKRHGDDVPEDVDVDLIHDEPPRREGALVVPE